MISIQCHKKQHTMKEIVLATSNAGKIKELQAILSPIHCLPQTILNIPSPEETGLSFVENALIKARHASMQANKPALADDSGLVIPALMGEPGIYSARYAGPNASDEDNIKRLLHNMQSLAPKDRIAYYFCSIALVQHAHDPMPMIASGLLKGEITFNPLGTEGFGYDPVFYVNEFQCTVAQLPATIKNRISHRAKALEQLHHQLQRLE